MQKILIKRQGSFVIAAFAAIGLIVVSAGAALSQGRQVTVQMNALHGGRISGSAIFTQRPKGVLVTVILKNALHTAIPVRIHGGKCPTPNRKPLFDLTDTNFGVSNTYLPGVQLSSLMRDVVVVHQPNNLKAYLACGYIR